MSRALPPVGWHRTMLQDAQVTTVCAWLNTVVLHEAHRASNVSAPATHTRAGAAQSKQEMRGVHVEAARALHIHEEGVGRRHEALQLVATELELLRRMQQVNVTHGNVRLQAREQPERAQRSAQRAMRASAERSGATGSLPAEHIACAACLAVLGWLGAPPRGDEHAAATGAAAADRGASAERGQTAHHS